MARPAALLVVSMLTWGCAQAPAPPAPRASESSATALAEAATPADPRTVPATPATIPPGAAPRDEPARQPTAAPEGAMTDYERELLAVLREDVHQGACEPRRAELPPEAVAGVECRLDDPLVDRVAVYGYGPDDAVTNPGLNDRAALAYLQRMDAQGVLGEPGDCLSGTPEDVPWQGLQADQPGVEHYPQVQYDGRPYSIFRYGCFENEEGMANVRATCGSGTYIGILGNTDELDRLTEWTLRWPDPEELSFSMPGICAGLQRDTF